MQTRAERFWAKVNKSPGQGPDGTCWVWTAYKNHGGYGWFRSESKSVLAHRLSWFWANGDILKGLILCHKGFYTHKDLAKFYGVARPMISYIVKRASWAHVTGLPVGA